MPRSLWGRRAWRKKADARRVTSGCRYMYQKKRKTLAGTMNLDIPPRNCAALHGRREKLLRCSFAATVWKGRILELLVWKWECFGATARPGKPGFTGAFRSVTVPSRTRKCWPARSNPISKLKAPEFDLSFENIIPLSGIPPTTRKSTGESWTNAPSSV